jgi:hypothetical protein
MVQFLSLLLRFRIRFPKRSMQFFINLILPDSYSPGVDAASNKNEYQGYFVAVNATGV